MSPTSLKRKKRIFQQTQTKYQQFTFKKKKENLPESQTKYKQLTFKKKKKKEERESFSKAKQNTDNLHFHIICILFCYFNFYSVFRILRN